MGSVSIDFIDNNGTVSTFILCPSLQFLIALIAPITFISFVIDNIFFITVLGGDSSGILINKRNTLIRFFPIVRIYQILL